MNDEQVLSNKDVGAVVKLAEKTVYSIAQEGELPAFELRDRWRVRFDEQRTNRGGGG